MVGVGVGAVLVDPIGVRSLTSLSRQLEVLPSPTLWEVYREREMRDEYAMMRERSE